MLISDKTGLKQIEIEEVKDYSCGGYHSLFLKSIFLLFFLIFIFLIFFYFFIFIKYKKKENGDIFVLGSNSNKQLGLDPQKYVNVEKPTFLMNLENATSVCCGYNHSFVFESKIFFFLIN